MTGPRALGSLVFTAALLAAAVARADDDPPDRRPHVITLDRLLLPDAIADRISGSGIDGRSLLSQHGRYEVTVGSLRLVLSRRLAIRCGLGMTVAVPPPVLGGSRSGLAAAGGVSLTLWRRGDVWLDADLSALRAGYDGGAVGDGTLLVALRAQP